MTFYYSKPFFKSNLLWIAPLFLLLVSCGTAKDRKAENIPGFTNNETNDRTQEALVSEYTDCDSLWKYVYNPGRLKVITKCKTVTGVIEESNADEDGDQHMLLKLDKGEEGLLTNKNKTKKNGDLVIEAVCANKVHAKKVGETCKGYINHVQLPAVGKHVRVTGSLVTDSHNGWNEIHPITRIEILQ